MRSHFDPSRIEAVLLLSALAVGGCLGGTSGTGTTTVGTAPTKAAFAPPSASDPKPGLTPKAGHNLLSNATFDEGRALPWTTSFTAPAAGTAAVIGGEFCLEVSNKGSANWDAQFRQRGMTVRKGHTYFMRFRARASQPTRIRPKVGMSGPPYSEYFWQQIDLTPSPQVFEYEFTPQGEDDPTAELAFHVGGDLAKNVQTPYTICVDDLELDDPAFTREEVKPPAPIARVRVNQTGYLPGLAKIATVASDRPPMTWELRDSSAAIVASGQTKPLGKDAAAGESLQLVDFSSFTKPGTGYTLAVGQDTSHPFDIAKNLYEKMKYQALAYFYHNRSGIEIVLPYAGDKQWTRPPGHVADKNVPCAPNLECKYALDVSGGWYDAGDHGKYVVNGGIAVWTLLDQYERAKFVGSPRGAEAFADGKMQIPENHNKVPDLLDEARWEIAFLLKMQVPDGQPLAGMVHHKVHDKEWTALGLRPDEDKVPRFLHAPSTAATLNLAATAAQAARIWKSFDPTFANQCLVAAEKAWRAAEAHPSAIAPASDSIGGGPYDDGNVDDEFYWAAAELFVTTGKPAYRSFLSKSNYYQAVPSTLADGGDAALTCAMSWQNTQALGSISLALVPNQLPLAEVLAIRKNVQKAADSFLEAMNGQGHRAPFNGSRNAYPWGSNSFVLNNALILALAADFSKDTRYLNGVVAAMDYLLGRNPMDQSYVTGYGERPLENPHHRFWAFQANHNYPKPPPGALSGGPNSGLQDPYVKAAGLTGCPPQKCWVDSIEAWSVNEITINWNAPLAWVTAYLDEKGDAGSPPALLH